MIEKLTTVEEGIKRLFVVGEHEEVPFQYTRTDGKTLFDTVEFNGNTVPLLKWRYNPRLNSIHDNLVLGTISKPGDPSTLKSLDFAPRSESMDQLLCREMDLAEFFLDSKIVSIMGYGIEKAANFIFHMDNGAMVNLEASVTLPADAVREEKHTLFTANGLVTDLCADKVVVNQQIYVFTDGNNPATYTDHDVNLFGLCLEDQDIAYACYALIVGTEDAGRWQKQAEHIEKLAKAALETLRTGKKYICG